MARTPLAIWSVRLVVLALGALLVIACGSEAGAIGDEPASQGPKVGQSAPDAVGGRSGLPCAVDKVLRERCQTCHGAHPAAGAQTSFVTQDDLQQDLGGKKAYELVKTRIHDQTQIMPPSPNKLSAEELATLDTWLDQGAPASSEACDLPPAGTGVKPLNCKPDLILKPSKAYTLPTPPPNDEYMCFGATVDLTKKRHVTAFAPHVDNPKILHHILIFKSPTPIGPDPFPCSAAGSAAWQLVGGWAPGGENFELPPEAGFPEEVGPTHWVLQVHYNSAGGKYAGESDASGYELCTTEQLRQYDAGVAGFGTIEFAIPPRSKLSLTCTVSSIEWAGKTFFAAAPHMHKLGAALTTERVGIDGSTEFIGGQENFDFNNQLTTNVKHVTIKAGDTLRTKCVWKNPGDGIVPFGETTDTEMCFNFLSYYPAIPLYPWVGPSMVPCIPEIGSPD